MADSPKRICWRFWTDDFLFDREELGDIGCGAIPDCKVWIDEANEGGMDKDGREYSSSAIVCVFGIWSIEVWWRSSGEGRRELSDRDIFKDGWVSYDSIEVLWEAFFSCVFGKLRFSSSSSSSKIVPPPGVGWYAVGWWRTSLKSRWAFTIDNWTHRYRREESFFASGRSKHVLKEWRIKSFFRSYFSKIFARGSWGWLIRMTVPTSAHSQSNWSLQKIRRQHPKLVTFFGAYSYFVIFFCQIFLFLQLTPFEMLFLLKKFSLLTTKIIVK